MTLPLVVVPGILEDEQGLRASLAPLGREVLVVANRGTSIEEMAGSLLSRTPERFVLLGHSLGGYVAQAAALAQPGRVAALALVSTSARADTEASREGRAALVTAARDDFGAVVGKLARAALARESRTDWLAPVEAMMLGGGLERFVREQNAAATRPAFIGRLGALRCQVLVVTGSGDAVIPSEASREIAAETGGRLVELACGHMPHLEEGDAFREALADWLAELP